jgi:hypothetical protein
MPIDPRIALAGVSPTYDFMGAFNTSRAAAQTAQANQMAMERRAAAQAALNAMRQPMSPAMQPAPAMQPGSSGPPIMGAPLPSVNAMGAGAPMPAVAAAPAAPVNAARDMSTLYQFMDIPEVKNYVDEMNRQETARVTAAGRATDDERLGDANTRARVQFTVEQSMPLWGLASVNPTDEELIAARDRTLAIPGVDAALVNQTYAPVLAMPFEGRVRYMADLSNSYAQSRAAEELRAPGSEDFNAGDRITFRSKEGRARLPGEVPPDIAVALTPGQRQSDENREEDRQRRLDDIQAGLDADAEAKQAEADALAGNPRADRDAVAAAQAQAAAALAAANANRRLRSGPPPRPAPTAPPAAGSGLPAVGPEGQRVRNRNTNRIFVSRGGRWVPE